MYSVSAFSDLWTSVDGMRMMTTTSTMMTMGANYGRIAPKVALGLVCIAYTVLPKPYSLMLLCL